MKKVLNNSKWIGKVIYYHDCIDSTNLEAKKLGRQKEPEGTVIWAKEQTSGKGRRGRSWESRSGDSLLMSVILRPGIPPSKASMLTLIQALAVRKAIHGMTGLEPLIKWPNDLVLGGKKVCGILTELELAGRETDFVIIGTGININQTGFSEDLEKTATSLSLETMGKQIEILALMEEVCKEFEIYYEEFLKTEDLSFVSEEYNRYLINKDRQIKVWDPAGEYEAKALGINTLGELLVETKEKELRTVYAGEVSVRGVYGYT